MQRRKQEVERQSPIRQIRKVTEMPLIADPEIVRAVPGQNEDERRENIERNKRAESEEEGWWKKPGGGEAVGRVERLIVTVSREQLHVWTLVGRRDGAGEYARLLWRAELLKDSRRP